MEFDIIKLFLDATLIVKVVIALLLLLSILSWAIIFSKRIQLARANRQADKFEQRFWDSDDLVNLYESLDLRRNGLFGNENIFYLGFKEFSRLQANQSTSHRDAIIQGTNRAMQVALNREVEKLEKHISFLATVASVSPYIGLFGTVWGIMHSFFGLSMVKQATLQSIAPGISEALIATAIGLFAAIPAVIAYNRLSLKLNTIEHKYENFVQDFITILHRKIHS